MSFMLLGILNSQAAGGVATPAMELISTQTSSGSTSSFTFSGLNVLADYKHLQLRWTAKSTSGEATFAVKFNGLTDANYNHKSFRYFATNLNNQDGSYNPYVNVQYGMGTSAGSNIFASGYLDILDYKNANSRPSVRGAYGYLNAADWYAGYVLGGTYTPSNQSVNSITVEAYSAVFANNTRVSLYGIRG